MEIERSYQSLGRIFLYPFLLGISSALGLVVALVKDDIWDGVGAFALGLSILVAGYYWTKASRTSA